MSKVKKVLQFISDHLDIVACLALGGLLYGAYGAVQRIDARIGFDGWSDTLYYILNMGVGVAALYVGWALKVRLHGELTVDQDIALRAAIACHIGPFWTNNALFAMLLEMAITAFWSLLLVGIVFGWARG